MKKEIVLSLLILTVLSCAKKKESPLLSAEACARTLYGLHAFPDESNPLGPQHDPMKDFEQADRLFKRCKQSEDRLGLVKSQMTDQRLVRLLEENEREAKLIQDCGKFVLEHTVKK